MTSAIETIQLRQLAPGDEDIAWDLQFRAFSDLDQRLRPNQENETEAAESHWRPWFARFFPHVIEHDQAGSWLAFDGDRPAGLAISLLREGSWILSILTVAPESQSRGIGRLLMDKTLERADGTVNQLLESSEDHRAMRRYAAAGFRLLPGLAAKGPIDRSLLPTTPRVRDGDPARAAELIAALDRSIRGSAHGPDIAAAAEGGRLLILDDGPDRGYTISGGEGCQLLAATSPAAAQELLWACLGVWTEGDFAFGPIRGDQQWAVQVALAARLPFRFGGCLAVRGETGPLDCYLPNGVFL